jgi:Transposase DDE domain
MEKTKVSKRILAGLNDGIQTISGSVPKPSRKFLKRMLLGMTMAGSVLLSEVARQPGMDRGITFHAAHKGLSAGLKSKQWGAVSVQDTYLNVASQKLDKNRLIAVDLGDITKPRSRKMPQIQTVHDGSTGELKKGWWLLEAEALTGAKHQRHVPLWLELFSIGKRKYQSTWTVIENALTTLVEKIGTGGTWVFDRGFDSGRFFAFLKSLTVDFVVRANAKRHVKDFTDGRTRALATVAQRALKSAPMLWKRTYAGQALLLKVGYAPIAIPKTGHSLSLIVVEGFGKNPLLLLTSRVIQRAEEAVVWAKAYLKRWGVEEAGRLIKQAFDLENLRVLSWAGLQKLVWCALWAYGLLCQLRFQAKKTYSQWLRFYPSFGPEPVFSYYRLAGAVRYLLRLNATTILHALETT